MNMQPDIISEEEKEFIVKIKANFYISADDLKEVIEMQLYDLWDNHFYDKNGGSIDGLKWNVLVRE